MVRAVGHRRVRNAVNFQPSGPLQRGRVLMFFELGICEDGQGVWRDVSDGKGTVRKASVEMRD